MMKRLLAVHVVGALSLATACSPGGEAARPRPAVDAAAPVKTEIATFALG
jgi:hypothetical protein